MQKMRVPVFKGQGILEYEDRPLPALQRADEVLVEVEACGICGSDLNILAVPPAHAATPNIIIGHEAVGKVVDIGSEVMNLEPGDRVVIAPRMTCGKCYYCRRGINNQCTNYRTLGTKIDGAFAPYLCAPESALYTISPIVSRDNAVFFEPLSCVVGSVKRAPIEAGSNVAIIGAGPMGVLFTLMYRLMGAGKIIMIDIASNRLDFAKEMGADEVINPHETDPVSAVKDITNVGVDMVVDAVGNQINTAVQLVRRGGNIILFGLRSNDQQNINQYSITRYDITIHGTFVGTNPFVQTIQLLESGRIQPSGLISHRVPLNDLEKGVALMRSGKGMKVVVEP